MEKNEVLSKEDVAKIDVVKKAAEGRNVLKHYGLISVGVSLGSLNENVKFIYNNFCRFLVMADSAYNIQDVKEVCDAMISLKIAEKDMIRSLILCMKTYIDKDKSENIYIKENFYTIEQWKVVLNNINVTTLDNEKFMKEICVSGLMRDKYEPIRGARSNISLIEFLKSSLEIEERYSCKIKQNVYNVPKCARILTSIIISDLNTKELLYDMSKVGYNCPEISKLRKLSDLESPKSHLLSPNDVREKLSLELYNLRNDDQVSKQRKFDQCLATFHNNNCEIGLACQFFLHYRKKYGENPQIDPILFQILNPDDVKQYQDDSRPEVLLILSESGEVSYAAPNLDIVQNEKERIIMSSKIVSITDK